jgi:hypothetical protein
VTAPNKEKPAGRAAQGEGVKPPDRAGDNQTVKSKPKKPTEAGRAADPNKKVKSAPEDQPGGAAQKQN